MAQTDSVYVRRVLRRHGFDFSVQDFYGLVDAGASPERTRVTRQLIELSENSAIASVLVAAYSGYVEGFRRDTTWNYQWKGSLRSYDVWAMGIESLVAAIGTARNCTGSDLHLIKSTKRDFVRSIQRARRQPDQLLFDSRYRPETDFGNLAEIEFEAEPITDEWTKAAIDELVDWLATEFSTEVSVARMVVETRVGGFPLGAKGDPASRARNCRDRKRLEAKVRGYVSPADGLAASVLSRAA